VGKKFVIIFIGAGIKELISPF